MKFSQPGEGCEKCGTESATQKHMSPVRGRVWGVCGPLARRGLVGGVRIPVRVKRPNKKKKRKTNTVGGWPENGRPKKLPVTKLPDPTRFQRIDGRGQGAVAGFNPLKVAEESHNKNKTRTTRSRK